VPDAIDQGEAPFIRPFMVDDGRRPLRAGHRRARRLLGWEPRHRLKDVLPRWSRPLKATRSPGTSATASPRRRGLTAAEHGMRDPERATRSTRPARRRRSTARPSWAHFVNLALGTWLVTSPPLLGTGSSALASVSDVLSGRRAGGLRALSLSWRLGWARWACAAIGALAAVRAAGVLGADRGGLPERHAGRRAGHRLGAGAAARTGRLAAGRDLAPATPPGWSYNPSAWTQRVPIIALALVGLYVSRYLAAYQLGHIDGVWDPFFAGGPRPAQRHRGDHHVERVARPGRSRCRLGALTYLLEILTGVIGSRRRWRTMPWLVLVFGLMIVPLGVTSIFFIIIQPIWIGTWCTLCLIGAAAMLLQIPYSLDELLATLQFLRRRRARGQELAAHPLHGDTDERRSGGPRAAGGRIRPFRDRGGPGHARRRREPAVEPRRCAPLIAVRRCCSRA
jgi:hypothetical protein